MVSLLTQSFRTKNGVFCNIGEGKNEVSNHTWLPDERLFGEPDRIDKPDKGETGETSKKVLPAQAQPVSVAYFRAGQIHAAIFSTSLSVF